MEYDVFISCKSEDYSIGEKLYCYLKNKVHLSVFFATQELRDIGKDDYGSVIDKALDASTHLIVLATKIEYLEEETSPYVYYEWSSFCKEKRAGRKAGNVISVLSDSISIDSLPWALRNLQSITIDKYEDVLDYLKKEPIIISKSYLNTNDHDVWNENKANYKFFDTHLWKQTLGTNDKEISQLKESFLESRNNIIKLLEKQRSDFRKISYDNIEQIDSFWELVDILFNQNVPINPVEGYVLGIAFLFSSPLFSLSSTYGKTAIKETIEWKDLVVDFDFPLETEVENDSYLSALRVLHYREISSLLTSHLQSINNYIVQEEKIRKCFSKAIEIILTYSGCDWDDYTNLKVVPNRYLEINNNLTIDLGKLTAIFRCVNTINIFHGRIPDYLFCILKKHHLSIEKWSNDEFTYQIVEDVENSNLLSLISNYSFNKNDFYKWNVLHEVIEIMDNDIKATNSILKQKNINLPYMGLAGAQSIQKLKGSLPTEGWEPCSIGVHVGDLKYLIENLGGTQLYGTDDCLSVIIREMIQNGRDAIKSRENMDSWFNNGAIYIHLTKLGDSYQLDIADNGIGMSKNCIQDHLLCFGESYWSSTLSLRENPGLKASGFSSIGHFGIGFYSLFMLANYVKVTTHRYTDNSCNYTTVEFLDGLTLLPIICQDSSVKSNMSTIVSFKFKPSNETQDASETMDFWYGYKRDRSDWPLVKKTCYLVAGLDVDVFYSEGNEPYRLIHQNVNNPLFNTVMWERNLLQDKSTANILHPKLERIVNKKGQLRALLSAPQEDIIEELSVIPTIRGLGSCSFYSKLYSSSLIGFIDFKSGGASRNTFVIDNELREILTEWILPHYFNNYTLLLNNLQLAMRYNVTFRALSISVSNIVDANEIKLYAFLKHNNINPFDTTTLEMIHKRLYVGLMDEYGHYVFGIFKTLDFPIIKEAFTALGLDDLQTCISKMPTSDYESDRWGSIHHDSFISERKKKFDKDSLLKKIDKMPRSNIDDIIKRFAIMLLLDPFREGTKRALNIWVNNMLIHICERPIEWDLFKKEDYELMRDFCVNDYEALKQMIIKRQTFRDGKI